MSRGSRRSALTQNREFELKFSVGQATATQLLKHGVLGKLPAPASDERLVSTYFDTADGRLRSRGVSLRVRRGAHGCVQTLKRSGASLVDRDEWERDGDGSLDMSWLRKTPLSDLFEGGTSLAACFTVDVKRTTLPISFEQTSIEGALDDGAIYAGGRSLPVLEFELEHKGGSRRGLVRLVRKLARDLPLVLSLSSKVERGFALADHSWGHPTKEVPLDLDEARTLREAFGAILQGCLHSLCRNAPLVGGPDNGEAVHKTRIALRHIRAALSLFAPVLRRKRLSCLQGEVKWISDRLGAARDADVFRHLASRDAHTSIAAALEPRRRRAHQRLEAALASARWRLLLVDLLAFSIGGVRRSRRESSAAPFLRRRVKHVYRRLAADTRGLRLVRPETLHDLRKRAKTLRYDLDLVGKLPRLGLRRKRLRRAGADLQALQEALGTIHDAEALRDRIERSILARRKPPRGIAAEGWSGLVEIARDLHAPADDREAIQAAAAAAKRLRRCAF